MSEPRPYGWRCPNCSVIWAPRFDYCPSCIIHANQAIADTALERLRDQERRRRELEREEMGRR